MRSPEATAQTRRNLVALAACALALVWAPERGAAQEPEARASNPFRLQRLTSHIERVRSEVASDRKRAGVIFLGAGSVLTTAGVALAIDPTLGPGDAAMSGADQLVAVWLPGASALTLGVLAFASPFEEERIAADFLARARGGLSDPTVVRDLAIEGYRHLVWFAHLGRRSRRTNAVVYSALGVSSAVAIANGWGFEQRPLAKDLVLWLPFGLFFGSLAVYETLTTSPGEDALNAYQAEVRHHEASLKAKPHTRDLRVVPVGFVGGGGLAAEMAW